MNPKGWKISSQLWAIFFLAVVVRMAMLFGLPPEHLPLDSGVIDTAESLLSGHGFADQVRGENGEVRFFPTAFEMPGHALVLAGLWKLVGVHSPIVLPLFQLLVDSFMVFAIFRIASLLFGEKVGLIGAVLFAIYLPEAYLSVFFKRDVWVSWGAILGAYCILRYVQTGKHVYPVGAGGILIGTTYFGPTILFLPFFLAFGLLLVGEKKKAFVSGLIMGAIVVIGLTPWVMRNYAVFGKFIPTRTAFWIVMWEGFGEVPNPFGAVTSDEVVYREIREQGFTGRNATLESDEFFKPRVMRVLREHPLWYAGLVVRRIPMALLINRTPWGVLQDRRFLYHRMYSTNNEEKSIFGFARFMIENNPGFLLTKVLDALLLGVALAGIWLSRRDDRLCFLLLCVPAYFVLVYIPMHIEGKYMVPGHWAYLIFCARTFGELAVRLRTPSVATA
jgi:hypothetical protein